MFILFSVSDHRSQPSLPALFPKAKYARITCTSLHFSTKRVIPFTTDRARAPPLICLQSRTQGSALSPKKKTPVSCGPIPGFLVLSPISLALGSATTRGQSQRPDKTKEPHSHDGALKYSAPIQEVSERCMLMLAPAPVASPLLLPLSVRCSMHDSAPFSSQHHSIIKREQTKTPIDKKRKRPTAV